MLGDHIYSIAPLFNKIARSHMYWGRKPLSGLQDAFRTLKEADIVLDPLCGGGTPIIASLIQKARVIATDLNPMAVFLSKVLVRPINIPMLESTFEGLEATIANRILEKYIIKCSFCGAKGYLDYLVWSGNGEQSKPEKIKTHCARCGKNILTELSHSRKKRQLDLSRIKPLQWYPKTFIRSTRIPPVKSHYELFTGRNLWSLAELMHAIENISDDNCRDALRYVFTGMLYSCSEMQMFSEKASSSSRGWTAYRYYAPSKRKEKNVWNTFQNRFKNFIACKRILNSLLPHIRITDCPRVFFSKGYEVLVLKADIFHLDRNLIRCATHIFLDPPYNDDIDYLGFSEFWGSWLKMRFDFESEWHPRTVKAKFLKRVLNIFYTNTKDHCKVTLAFGPKKVEGWNLEESISESGYVVDRLVPFFYDNSYKRGGLDRNEDRLLTLVKKKVAKQKTKDNQQKAYSWESQEVVPYLRVAHFFSPSCSAETLRERAARLVPERLQNALGLAGQNTINEARKSNALSKRTYYTLCYALLSEILTVDNWEIYYTDKSLLLDNTFLRFPKNSANKLITQVTEGAVFAARKGPRKILFCFDKQGTTKLRTIASRVRERDKGAYNLICIMIVESSQKMNQLRNISHVKNWHRGFFICFDDIRDRYEEICQRTSIELLAPCSLLDKTPKQKDVGVTVLEAVVVKNFRVGGKDSSYYKLRFEAPQLQHIVPGQFIMTDTSLRKGIIKSRPVIFSKLKSQIHFNRKAFLKRPFGIHRAFYPGFGVDYLRKLDLPPNLATILHTARPNQFDIFYKVIPNGLGTKELTELRKGDHIQMIGPLGKRFDLRDLRSQGVKEIHVIGGGVGMAPLIFMVQALRFYAFRVIAFIGIESLELLRHKDDLAESYVSDPTDVKICVDDLLAAGLKHEDIFVSYDKQSERDSGITNNIHQGFVSEHYQNYLIHSDRTKNGIVQAFTCGPMLMMKEISDITQRYNIRLKVLLEKHMACGIGVCFSCVCKTKKNNKVHNSRVCVDGPVFDAKDIAW